MHPEIENLIRLAIADGQITESEKKVILKKATDLGVDSDEVLMVLEGNLHQWQAANSKPLNQKTGLLKSCPACGDSTEAFANKCKSCGHEFRYDALNLLLNDIKTNSTSQAEIIRNFKIPINKESIVEFITYSLGQLNSTDLSVAIKGAWQGKLTEAIELIKITPDLGFSADYLNELTSRLTQIRFKSSIESGQIDHNSNINELLASIKSIKDEKQKAKSSSSKDKMDEDAFDNRIVDLIKHHPIPSSKAEIINFISLCVSNSANKSALGTLDQISLAWNAKALELIYKSKIIFSDETGFMKEITSYENELKKAKKQHHVIRLIIAIALIVGIIYWLKSTN